MAKRELTKALENVAKQTDDSTFNTDKVVDIKTGKPVISDPLKPARDQFAAGLEMEAKRRDVTMTTKYTPQGQQGLILANIYTQQTQPQSSGGLISTPTQKIVAQRAFQAREAGQPACSVIPPNKTAQHFIIPV